MTTRYHHQNGIFLAAGVAIQWRKLPACESRKEIDGKQDACPNFQLERSTGASCGLPQSHRGSAVAVPTWDKSAYRLADDFEAADG